MSGIVSSRACSRSASVVTVSAVGSPLGGTARRLTWAPSPPARPCQVKVASTTCSHPHSSRNTHRPLQRPITRVCTSTSASSRDANSTPTKSRRVLADYASAMRLGINKRSAVAFKNTGLSAG